MIDLGFIVSKEDSCQDIQALAFYELAKGGAIIFGLLTLLVIYGALDRYLSRKMPTVREINQDRLASAIYHGMKWWGIVWAVCFFGYIGLK